MIYSDKKHYDSPIADIEMFSAVSIITTSTDSQDPGGEVIEPEF